MSGLQLVDKDYQSDKSKCGITKAPPFHLFSKHKLLPLELEGVIIPWSEEIMDGFTTDYKLISATGIEYHLLSDEPWSQIFKDLAWATVNLEGLIETQSFIFIPKDVLSFRGGRSQQIGA